MNRIIILLTLFLNVISLSIASNILTDEVQEIYYNGANYEILVTDSDLKIEDVNKPFWQEKFKIPVHTEKMLDPEYTYWIKFKLKNEIQEQKDLLLVVYSHQTSEVDFFIPEEKNKYYQRTLGADFKFDSRKYDDKNFIFDVPYSPKNEVYYLKYQSEIPVKLSFTVESTRNFLKEHNKRYNLTFFVFGLIFMVILYNAYLYFYARKKAFLFVAGYAISAALYILDIDGFGFQYFWPDFPGFNHFSFQVTNGLMVVFTLMLSSVFLNLKKNSVTLYYVHILAIVFKLISLILIEDYVLDLKIDVILLSIPVFTSMSQRKKKNHYMVSLFTAALSVFWIGYLFFTLQIIGVISGNFNSYTVLKYTLIVQIVLLSKSLSERYHITFLKIHHKHFADLASENTNEAKKANRELSTQILKLTTQIQQLERDLDDKGKDYKELKSEYVYLKVQLQELEDEYNSQSSFLSF